MSRASLILVAAFCFGCTQASQPQVEDAAPSPTPVDFERLPAVLSGVQKSARMSLYEGLPSEFWEPQLREEELRRKSTVSLHGYRFYEETLALQPADAEKLTELFSAKASFKRYGGAKKCGGYGPDYCVEWKSSESATQALVCLECGEVKMFGSRSELYCDFGQEAVERIQRVLQPYRKNRPKA
jgi:hypothetical protein